MWSKNILNFLKELKVNNNREWFQDNKERYNNLKKELEFFIALVIERLKKYDESISLVQPKDCIFRIYRDVRFSKDKSPYKTNMGAFIVPGGKNSGHAGYYLHIEPDNSFFAGGIHMPASEILKKVRKEIYYNVEEFKEIIQEKKFRKEFNTISGEQLKTSPKDFAKEWPDIELLKFKSYTVFKPINESTLVQPDFIDIAEETFLAMVSFVRFINRAISDN